MSFSRAFLDELVSRNDIEQVIGEQVSLRRAGTNIVGLCPFHNERTPSFTVFPETQSFYCFGCGVGGDAITYVMRYQNLDYVGAVEYLAKRSGIPIEQEEDGTHTHRINRERVFEMNKLAAHFFHSSLSSPAAGYAREYINKRGLTKSAIVHFGIGYAPDSRDMLTSMLRSKGYSAEEIKAAFLGGISSSGAVYDYFRNRLMFPIIDLNGRVIAFGGRRLNEADRSKYINTSDTPVFKKSKNLFALNFAQKVGNKELIMCEGYMDVVALHQAGFVNAVATLGTAITSEQARIIKRYADKVYLAYDIDEAGRKATLNGISLLNQVGVTAKIITLSGDTKDPDEYIKKNGAAAFKRLLEDSSGQVDFRIDELLRKFDLSVAEEKLRATRAAMELVSQLETRVEREIYTERLSTKLGLKKESLLGDIEKTAAANEKKRKKQQMTKITEKTLGYGDRINTDRIKMSATATIEEAVLGRLLYKPELYSQVKERLNADCFLTAFNRRVYIAYLPDWESQGRISFAKNDVFTPEENGAITRMAVNAANKICTREELLRLLDLLDAEKAKQDFDKRIEDDPSALNEYIEAIKNAKKH